MGAIDAKLVEKPAEAEQNRQLQAPNRGSTWAANQRPREEAMTGPRFEQTIMQLQVSSFPSELGGWLKSCSNAGQQYTRIESLLCGNLANIADN